MADPARTVQSTPDSTLQNGGRTVPGCGSRDSAGGLVLRHVWVRGGVFRSPYWAPCGCVLTKARPAAMPLWLDVFNLLAVFCRGTVVNRWPPLAHAVLHVH